MTDVVDRIRVRADPSLRRLAPGVWVGGSPLRLLRVTPDGDAVMRRLGDDLVGVGSAPVAALMDRLVRIGAAHPSPAAGGPDATAVTVVVPVRDRTESLECLLDGVARASHRPGALVVVDDASADGAAVEAVASRHSATLRRHESPQGPAAARNTGLAAVRTELVAFVDSDVVPTQGWMEPLLAALSDPSVAVVAPRVRSAAGDGVLARYEMTHSPLDMGPRPAEVRPRAVVSYVPGATLLARTSVIRSIGGFDSSMTVGEDVDLVWRTVEAGHRVRYEPGAEVSHSPRRSWSGWANQRFGYGSSAAELDLRHPRAVAPVVCSPWSAATWTLAACGHPLVGAALAAGSAVALVGKLRDAPWHSSISLAVRGHLAAGRQLSRAAVRPWWPLLAGAALAGRRPRRTALGLLGAAVLSTSGDGVQRCVALADDVVYSAGVWSGALRTRRPGALLPAFPRWP